MKTIEDLILYHNSDNRAKIYNRVSNMIYSEFGIRSAETVMLCSYVVNKLIEDGRLKVNDHKRIDKSGYIETH